MTDTSNGRRPERPSGTKGPLASLVGIVVILGIGAAVGWAGSQGGATVGGFPLALLVIAGVFVVQFVAFVPAWLRQTEHFYDLVGSFTFIAAIVASLVASRHTDATAVLLTGMVVVWAARLGLFLFRRVRRAGSDTRFDAIKPDFWRFLTVWTMQGLWVTVTVAAALAGVTATHRPGVGALTVIGVAVWCAGLAFEAVADAQKSRFRAEAANRGDFMRTGLWAWSRHPNYAGEIALWLGVALVALPALGGWQYATLISPLFVALLLTRVSGVPLLERKADQRWGGQAEYEAYKARTPVLVPRPPRSAATR